MELKKDKNRFFSTQSSKVYGQQALINLLRVEHIDFSEYDHWLAEQGPTTQFNCITNTLQEINQIWLNQSHQFNIKKVHEFLKFLLLRMAGVQLPSTFNLMVVDRIFSNIAELLHNYKNHYPGGLSQSSHLPLEQVLNRFSASVFTPFDGGCYTAPGITLMPLLRFWNSFAPLSKEVLTGIVIALSRFAQNADFFPVTIDLHFLSAHFEKGLPDTKSQTIKWWLCTLGELSKQQVLRVFSIKIEHINKLLQKIAENKDVNLMSVAEILRSIDIQVRAGTVSNAQLLRFASIENLVLSTLQSREILNSKDIANVAVNIMNILDFLELNGRVTIKPLQSLLAAMKQQSDCIRPSFALAKHISQTLTAIGQIVKIKHLHASIDKDILNLVEQLLEKINDSTKVRIELDREEKKVNSKEINMAVHAMVAALRGSALLGISEPTETTRSLATRAEEYLQAYQENLEVGLYPKLLSQYGLYLDVTGSKCPSWVADGLEKYKPAPPRAESTHAKTVKCLEQRGCTVEAEKLLMGMISYPVDIFCSPEEGKLSIGEINGRRGDLSGRDFHYGQHRWGEPKDWFKSMVFAFRTGISIQFFDLALENWTPETIAAAMVKAAIAPKKLAVTGEQLYQFIARVTPENKPLWQRNLTTGKKAITEPPPSIPASAPNPQDYTSIWGEDVQEVAGQDKKEKKKTNRKKEINNQVTANYFFSQVTNQNLTNLKKSLSFGNPLNPSSGQEDVDVIAVALLCAMRQKQLVPNKKKKRAQNIIDFLIQKTSIDQLISTKSLGQGQNISPLILALHLETSDPEIYQAVSVKLAAMKEKKEIDGKDKMPALPEIMHKARESANKFQKFPEFDPASLIQLEELPEDPDYEKESKQFGPKLHSNIQRIKFSESIIERRLRPEDLEFIHDKVGELIDIEYVNYPLSFLLQRAKKGDAAAQFVYGKNLLLSKGVKFNPHLAKYWISQAANQGFTDAQLLMGTFLNDIEEVAYYESILAKKKIPFMHARLGFLYSNSSEVPQDNERAIFHYQKAARASIRNAQLNLGLMYCQGTRTIQDLDSAIFWLEKAAEKNWDDVLPIKTDDISALASALAFDPLHSNPRLRRTQGIAFLTLGEIYLSNLKKRDLKKAYHYFCLADKAGNKYVPDSLGRYYEEKGEYDKAFDSYKKAIKQGNFDSADRLNQLMKKQGEFLAKKKKNLDPGQLRAAYQQAADQGSVPAKKILIAMCTRGEGGPKDLKKAKALLEELLPTKDAEIQYKVGLNYILGQNNFKKNIDQGLKLWQMSAQQNNTDALFHLGLAYQQGKIVTKNLSTAEQYYVQAEAQGDERAKTNLVILRTEQFKDKQKAKIKHQVTSSQREKKTTHLGTLSLIQFMSALGEREQECSINSEEEEALNKAKLEVKPKARAESNPPKVAKKISTQPASEPDILTGVMTLFHEAERRFRLDPEGNRAELAALAQKVGQILQILDKEEEAQTYFKIVEDLEKKQRSGRPPTF